MKVLELITALTETLFQHGPDVDVYIVDGANGPIATGELIARVGVAGDSNGFQNAQVVLMSRKFADIHDELLAEHAAEVARGALDKARQA